MHLSLKESIELKSEQYTLHGGVLKFIKYQKSKTQINNFLIKLDVF